MSNKVKAIPDGYRSVTPYLCVKGCADAIAFYKKAFGAQELMRMDMPGGKIAHAELEIGNSRLMLADEYPEMEFLSPASMGGSPLNIYLYVENADETIQRAVGAGARVKKPLENQFYGDRSGCIVDPFGHVWHVSTRIENLPPEEIKKRGEQFMAAHAKG